MENGRSVRLKCSRYISCFLQPVTAVGYLEQTRLHPCYILPGSAISPEHPDSRTIPVMPNNILSLLPVATVILIISTTLPGAGTSQAADLEREQRLADEIVEAILDGEPVMLTADGHEFLGIYTPAESEPEHGAAIILHGRGMHPDWAQIVNPLRVELPARGWSTLSLQMPVLEKDASFYEYVEILPEAIPRITAAIRYLQAQGSKHITLIAHSCGVHMSMAWVEQHGTAGIDAYIGIGMGATDYQQPMRKPFPFGKIRVPLLNIVGSEDYPAVQRQAKALESLLNDLPPGSAQVRIEGAGHYFDNQNEALVEAVIDWLETL